MSKTLLSGRNDGVPKISEAEPVVHDLQLNAIGVDVSARLVMV